MPRSCVISTGCRTFAGYSPAMRNSSLTEPNPPGKNANIPFAFAHPLEHLPRPLRPLPAAPVLPMATPTELIPELLEAGVHFGHQTKRWNPKMKPFIFDARNGIHIIDLSKTLNQLETACDFLTDTVSKGGYVLFVGTKKQAQEAVKESAKSCGQHHVTGRWLGGTLTNFNTVKRSIGRMKEIEKMDTDGSI